MATTRVPRVRVRGTRAVGPNVQTGRPGPATGRTLAAVQRRGRNAKRAAGKGTGGGNVATSVGRPGVGRVVVKATNFPKNKTLRNAKILTRVPKGVNAGNNRVISGRMPGSGTRAYVLVPKNQSYQKIAPGATLS